MIAFGQTQELSINVDYDVVFSLKNPSSHTANPAALAWSPIDSIRKANLSYNTQSGGFHRILNAQEQQRLSLGTESYRRLNNTMLYGTFEYAKGWESKHNYSNMYYAYRGTPYLFIDTIANGEIDREQYQMECKIAHSFSPALTIAGELDYRVGIASQNKDPRALNKMVDIKNKLGLLYHKNTMTIGLDAFYNYYTEDIEVITVRDNTTHDMFGTTGLGTYSKHNWSKFYRTYHNHTYGGDVQVILANNVLELGHTIEHETTLDGRGKNGANWSSVKTDSYYNTRQSHIKDIYTIDDDNYNHQFVLSLNQKEALGTEVLQELKKVNENYKTYQWETLLEEDKYHRIQQEGTFTYTYSKFKKPLLRTYSLGTMVHYYKQEEVYNYQDLQANYSNMAYNINASKLWQWGTHSLDTRLDICYQINLENSQNLNYNSTITRLIISPDLEYFSSDLTGGMLTLNYAYTAPNNYHYYITTNYAFKHTNNTYFTTPNRHHTSITLGLMF